MIYTRRGEFLAAKPAPARRLQHFDRMQVARCAGDGAIPDEPQILDALEAGESIAAKTVLRATSRWQGGSYND